MFSDKTNLSFGNPHQLSICRFSQNEFECLKIILEHKNP
jgi:hypothetical protein